MDEYKNKFRSIIYDYDHDKVVQNPKENILNLVNGLIGSGMINISHHKKVQEVYLLQVVLK